VIAAPTLVMPDEYRVFAKRPDEPAEMVRAQLTPAYVVSGDIPPWE
jgi:hypothetical protein